MSKVLPILANQAASFAISYLANNTPSFLTPSLQDRVKGCYDKARKEWKCKAARDRYDGKEFKHLDELKSYVIGEKGEIDEELEELISRWVSNMQSDPVCASHINSLKNDEILRIVRDFPHLYFSIIERIDGTSTQLTEIKDSLDRIEKLLKAVLDDGTNSRQSIASIDQHLVELLRQAGVNIEPSVLKDTPSVNPEESELEIKLKERFDKSKKSHPSFQFMEIDEDLYPRCVQLHYKASDTNDNNEILPIRDIIANSWKKGKNHLFLEGDGGIGKSVTLLSIPKIIAPLSHQIPAILYIQLKELKVSTENETISDYIESEIFSGNERLFKQFCELSDLPWSNGPRVLLLFDGFDEVIQSRKASIGGDIRRWAMNRSGIQVVVTSRYDIRSYVQIDEEHSRVLLQPLSRELIQNYLTKLGIPHPKKASQWRIIDHPLMLSLYANTDEAIRNHEGTDILDFKASNSSGAIIWNYLQRELWRHQNNHESLAKCIIATEFIAPKLAWEMHLNNNYPFDTTSFHKHIENALDELYKLKDEGLPPHIRQVLHNIDLPSFKIKEMSRFLEEEIRLFVVNNGKLSLMHQQFTDALAAIHLINISYASQELPKEWKEPLASDVLTFVVELITGEEANRLWEQNRCSKDYCDAAMINMFELQSRKRDYDFSALDFSRLDLRQFSLLPYKDPQSSILHLSHTPESNTDLSVTHDTFVSRWKDAREVFYSYRVSFKERRCVSRGLHDIHVWDMDTGQHLRAIKAAEGYVYAFDITHDGKRCVCGGDNNTIRIWDLDSGDCLNSFDGQEGGIASIEISPKDDRAVCIYNNNNKCELYILDLYSGQFTELKGHSKVVNVIRFTPDGEKCISASAKGSTRVWDMKSGECLKILQTCQHRLQDLQVYSEGKKCISCGFDGTLRIWNLESEDDPIIMNSTDVLKEPNTIFKSIAISSNEKICVCSTITRLLLVWDLESKSILHILRGHWGGISDLFVYADGKRCITSASDGTCRIWDLELGKLVQILDGNTAIQDLFLSPDETTCCSIAFDNSIRIWDLETQQSIRSFDTHKHSIGQLEVTFMGRKFVIGSNDSILRVWDMKSRCLERLLIGHTGPIERFILTPDGTQCVSWARDKTLRIWDLSTGNCTRVIDGPKCNIRQLTISPDGKKCVCTFWDGSPRIWALKTGRSFTFFERKKRIRSLTLIPKKKKAVTISSNSQLKVWDLKSGKSKVLLDYAGGPDTFISPNGKKCYNIHFNKIRCFDLDSNEFKQLTIDKTHSIESFFLLPDRNKCIFGTYEGSIAYLDLNTEEVIISEKGHEQIVNKMALNPIGKICVSVALDSSLCVWSYGGGKPRLLQKLEFPDTTITNLFVSPDAKNCFIGTLDTILILDLESYNISSINVLPLTVLGIDFSLSRIPPKLKDDLKQNGAIV